MKPINKVLEVKNIIKDPFSDYAQLSKKEKAVGKEAVMGYTDDEIARMLGMSVWTVKAHMRSVCKTTGLKKQRLSGWVIEKIYAVLSEPSE